MIKGRKMKMVRDGIEKGKGRWRPRHKVTKKDGHLGGNENKMQVARWCDLLIFEIVFKEL